MKATSVGRGKFAKVLLFDDLRGWGEGADTTWKGYSRTRSPRSCGGCAKRPENAGAPAAVIPVLRPPLLLEEPRAARGPLGTGGHVNIDCIGVQRAGRSGVRVTPLGLGSPGSSGTETSSSPRAPSRALAGVHPRPGGVSSPAPAGCGHLVSGSGNLVSPLGGFLCGWSLFSYVALRAPSNGNCLLGFTWFVAAPTWAPRSLSG